MDAQSRGRVEDIDPADQWVLNPETGNYELRLDRSGPQQPETGTAHGAAGPSARRRAPGPRKDSASGTRTGAGSGSGTRTGSGSGSRTGSGSGSRTGSGSGSRTGSGSGSRTGSGSGTRTGSGSRSGSGSRTSADPARPVPGQRRRTAAAPPDPRGRRKRKQGASGKKKAVLWTAGIMGFVVVGASVTAYVIYNKLNGNINTIDVGDAANGGSLKDGPINILILGSDVRTGEGNEAYGDRENSTGHADTTFLFHVSEDRTNATALSIPRDLKTEIPDCPTKQPDGSTKVIPGNPFTRFNESFGVEGRDPGCTMRTVEKLIGVKPDHFMMADFNAVKTLTTAIEGVEVCLAEPIRDKSSKLNLDAGDHTIMGEQALAFLRNRHGLGNESDLDRIKQQQQFIASMIRKMKEETLGNPKRMYNLADAVTQALTVDKGIGDIPKLTGLGQEISSIDLKNITFATVPVQDNPAETVKATVVLDQAKAPQVFSMIQNDVSFTEVKKKEKAAKSKQEALLKGDRAEASEVRVDVYNGSGIAGAAQQTLSWLQNQQGVLKSSNQSNAPKEQDKTSLEYGPNQAGQARKLADLMGLPASAMKPAAEDAEAMQPMKLVLGGDFKGAGVSIAPPKKAPDVGQVGADKRICAQ
ncbi:LCP family protein [Streptomyces lichenis]|uniref:LCP family protein n=1 Tax=Streptomyces lichenis TaxID=2306967 RepID=A0ABT0IHI3_9ACTN|nr:LCP family protein [Streptomyces lichenis]MCK8680761.1 LCP family protein [Streptomyces lichenis]